MKSEARPFHVMAKPGGPLCNLDCTYCYYLRKKEMFGPGATFRMSPDVLEAYVRGYIEAHPGPEVTFGWQGGEPTLLGVDFFRAAVTLQEQYRKPGTRILNTLQTNGTRVDDAWCEFLAANRFLVGISIDGPPELHDAYRLDKGGSPTSGRVLDGLSRLQDYDVDVNVLCTVNSRNADHPRDVYRFFVDSGLEFVQFIPIVDLAPDGTVAPWSVAGAAWGSFLNGVFDTWLRRDVGTVFVQLFDVALEAAVGMEPTLCVHASTCGRGLAIEHDGSVYACDHYVLPTHRLGTVETDDFAAMLDSPQQRRFGADKRDGLPASCRACPVLAYCNGGCPKDRLAKTAAGEPGLNHLCAGYYAFFTHARPTLERMAALLAASRPAADVMAELPRPGRNEPCPCGSGRKYKACCQLAEQEPVA